MKILDFKENSIFFSEKCDNFYTRLRKLKRRAQENCVKAVCINKTFKNAKIMKAWESFLHLTIIELNCKSPAASIVVLLVKVISQKILIPQKHNFDDETEQQARKATKVHEAKTSQIQ